MEPGSKRNTLTTVKLNVCHNRKSQFVITTELVFVKTVIEECTEQPPDTDIIIWSFLDSDSRIWNIEVYQNIVYCHNHFMKLELNCIILKC